MQKQPPDPLFTSWQALAEAGRVPLLLIRHGRTASNLQKRFVGKSDVPLDEEGLRQASRLAARLGALDRSGLYTSPLSRARQTAAALGSPTLVDGLQELDQGVFEGHDGPSMMAAHPQVFAGWVTDPTNVRIPEGETLGECRDRALAALTGLLETHRPGPPVLVVAHQMVLATVILSALELPLRFVKKVKQGNTAVNLMSWGEGRLEVHRLNDTRHLA